MGCLSLTCTLSLAQRERLGRMDLLKNTMILMIRSRKGMTLIGINLSQSQSTSFMVEMAMGGTQSKRQSKT